MSFSAVSRIMGLAGLETQHIGARGILALFSRL